ncbi:MAG: hypothetical protein ACRDUV_06425 [Pseudonocardiaceae bacterium]
MGDTVVCRFVVVPDRMMALDLLLRLRSHARLVSYPSGRPGPLSAAGLATGLKGVRGLADVETAVRGAYGFLG